jgi:microcystin-dependent protein
MPYYSTVLPAGFEWPSGQTLTSGNYLEYAAIMGGYGTPDCRGLVDATLDNLGGTSAGRLPSGYIAQTTLGAIGGADGIALSTAMIPSHNHVMYFNDPTHTHNFNQSGGLGVSSYVYTNTSPQYFYYQGGGQGAQQYATYIQGAGTGCYIGYPAGNNNSITSSVGSGSAHQNLQPTVMMGKLLVVE